MLQAASTLEFCTQVDCVCEHLGTNLAGDITGSAIKHLLICKYQQQCHWLGEVLIERL